MADKIIYYAVVNDLSSVIVRLACSAVLTRRRVACVMKRSLGI